MADVLRTAIHFLRQQAGADLRQWQWGQLRKLTLLHPAGERPPLNRVFNLGPFPIGGDTNTLARAHVRLDQPLDNPPAIASMRLVIDVGNWEENRFILPGGQSGNPLSPHYADQLPLWRQGQAISIAWSPANVERVARSTLQLMPSKEH
jgi:penicillin amidase